MAIDRKYGTSLDIGDLLKKDNDVANVKSNVDNPARADANKQKESKNHTTSNLLLKYGTPVYIMLLLVLSAFVLSQPATLYNIEVNVKNSLLAQYQQQISAEINKDFFALSEQQKSRIIDERLNQVVQSSEFARQVKTAADAYKKFYQDSQGQTYLYSSDPYYFFRLARNLVERGMLADSITGNGIIKDSLRFFPFGDFPGFTVFPYVLFYFFNILKILIPSISLLTATFYFPVFIGVFSVILVFFIAKKSLNDSAGFIAAFLFAIHPLFLFWNYAGYADTQILAQFWSLLNIILFMYLIDLSKKVYSLMAFLVFLPVIYVSSYIWSGLFFVPLLFICFFVSWLAIWFLRKIFLENKKYYSFLLIILFFVGFLSANYVLQSYYDRILAFLNIAEPMYNIFPTAFSSVTELQSAETFGKFVVALGGNLLIFILIIELLFFVKNLFSRKIHYCKYELLFFVWFFLMAVPAFKSARFLFFLVTPFSLIVGKGFYRISLFLHKLFKSILKLQIKEFYASFASILVILLVIFFALNPNPFVAKTKLPFMTKSVADTTDFIRLNSANDAVIATSWDLGYLWQAFARRATFFDGGLFNTQRLYWISKAVSADNETVSASIATILSCGGDLGLVGIFDELSRVLPEKLTVFNQLMASNNWRVKNAASKYLNISEDIFCNKTNEVFFVVTESMLYQIPAFIHYADWDFNSASIRMSVKGKSESEAIAVLKSKYNMSDDGAQLQYYDAKSFVDLIIPMNIDRVRHCQQSGELLLCDNGFVVNTKNLNATYHGFHPKSLVFVKNGNRKVIDFKDAKLDYSVVVFSTQDGYRSILMDSSLVNTTIVRMFAGDSFDNFDFVFASRETPERIIVYKLKSNKSLPQ